jgi:hypothetical protein
MKVEIRNWIVVIILLCLGFIVGRITITPNVNANPQETGVGRYQMQVGDIDAPILFFNAKGVVDTTWDLRTGRTLFRINTVTGDVDYFQYRMCFASDTAATWTYKWSTLTEREVIKNR